MTNVRFPGQRDDDIHDHYRFGDELGSGAFSVVVAATHKKTGEKVAIKVVDREETDSEEMLAEITVMAAIAHPHAVSYIEMWVEDDEYYVVLERITGGELFDRIIEMSFFTEKQASKSIKEALQAIAFIHGMDYIHRDLKPENLLLASHEEDAAIKIADFGFATRIEKDGFLDEYLGTPPYMAPELIILSDETVIGQYGKPVDMWALGCILYILLSGLHPFQMEDEDEMFEVIASGDLEWLGDDWDDISPEAKDLVERMICADPAQRITAEQALAHPWISVGVDNELKSQDAIRKFQLRKKLKGAVFSVMASNKLKRSINSMKALSDSLKNQ